MPDLITLFTDASWCPNTRVAGWAAWAKCNGGTMRQSGAMKSLVESSELAEVMAAANGLHQVVRHFGPTPGTTVLVQLDCLGAMRALESGEKWPQVVHEWERLRIGSELRLKYRHVKAHQGGKTPRSWVNGWADREAKAHMRVARSAHRVTPDFSSGRSVNAELCFISQHDAGMELEGARAWPMRLH